MSNNNSIWFAVDDDGTQMGLNHKPERGTSFWNKGRWIYAIEKGVVACKIEPPLSIQAITGRTLTWEDEPIEWVPNEKKYPIGGYAPGNYRCKCVSCGNMFSGDKRAVQCEPCAESVLGAPIPEDVAEPEPKLSDFYDESDPRGCSSSEYNDYIKALKCWQEKQSNQ